MKPILLDDIFMNKSEIPMGGKNEDEKFEKSQALPSLQF
jgi:hypothetical protein